MCIRSLQMLWAKLFHAEEFSRIAQTRRHLQSTVPAHCREQGGNDQHFATARRGNVGG
jgi:hypothetical protein